MTDPWQVLGLARGCTLAEVKAAYAKLLRQRRPDTDPAGFRELRAAYEQLRDALERDEQPMPWYVTASPPTPIADDADDDAPDDHEELVEFDEFVPEATFSPPAPPRRQFAPRRAAATTAEALAAIEQDRILDVKALLERALATGDEATSHTVLGALVVRAAEPADEHTGTSLLAIARATALFDVAAAEQLADLVFRQRVRLTQHDLEPLLALGRELVAADLATRALVHRVLLEPPAKVAADDVAKMITLLRGWRGSKRMAQHLFVERFPEHKPAMPRPATPMVKAVQNLTTRRTKWSRNEFFKFWMILVVFAAIARCASQHRELPTWSGGPPQWRFTSGSGTTRDLPPEVYRFLGREPPRRTGAEPPPAQAQPSHPEAPPPHEPRHE